MSNKMRRSALIKFVPQLVTIGPIHPCQLTPSTLLSQGALPALSPARAADSLSVHVRAVLTHRCNAIATRPVSASNLRHRFALRRAQDTPIDSWMTHSKASFAKSIPSIVFHFYKSRVAFGTITSPRRLFGPRDGRRIRRKRGSASSAIALVAALCLLRLTCFFVLACRVLTLARRPSGHLATAARDKRLLPSEIPTWKCLEPEHLQKSRCKNPKARA